MQFTITRRKDDIAIFRKKIRNAHRRALDKKKKKRERDAQRSLLFFAFHFRLGGNEPLTEYSTGFGQ